MNRLFKAVLVAFTLAVIPRFVMTEAYIIPQDANGNIPGDASQQGVDVIDSTAALVNGGLNTPVCLHWVIVSSDVVTNYAVLRDSDTSNTTSNIKMTLYANNTGGTSLATASQVMIINPCAIFRNGIQIHLNQNTSAGGRWQFGVRRRSIGNARGVDTSFTDQAD